MHVPEPDEALLERAKEAALRRVETDAERVADELKPVLLHVAESLREAGTGALFPAATSAASVKAACRMKAGLLRRFRAALGHGLAEYLKRCRMEAAKDLLRYRDLKVWRIAFFTGYAGLQTFWRAFKTATGKSPEAFRRASEPRQRRLVPETEMTSDRFWWRAILGDLTPEEHEGLLERLRERLEALEPPTEALPPPWARIELSGFADPAQAVEELWGSVSELPAAEQLAWARGVAVDSPAFFELLGRKIEEVGRHDPAGALQLADLALAHLDRNAEDLQPETGSLQARGLAWRANALRLNHNFDAAAQAFTTAWEMWETAARPPCVEAEICDFEAALLREQRRNEEALERLNRAASLAQAHGLPRVLVTALLQRVVLVAYSGGKPRSAIGDLRLALHRLEGQDEPYLRLAAYSNLVAAYALAGQHREALEVLPRARALCDELGERTTYFILKWTEGLARRDLGESDAAQRLLEQARDGFIERDARDNAAVVALDLALLHLAEGHPGEAARLGSEAIPIFESLGIVPEKLGAAKLLREAITAGDLTAEILRSARSELDWALPTEPAVRPISPARDL